MFDEEGITPSLGNPDATVVVVTKTVYQAATVTLTATTTILKTTTASLNATAASSSKLIIPHHPKVDTAFTAVFGFLCLVLIVGLIIRKKSKKLKLLNIPLILGTFFNALGHFLHADYNFISQKYELGRVVRIILTLAPIFYSLGLFTLHRKTRNRASVRSAMMFSILAGIHVLYCLIAAFGDGAVLFYTGQKWGEMDVAKHLAVSQVFGQQFMLCLMMGMWIRGRNVPQDGTRSLCMEEILALVTIPTILAALVVRVSVQFIIMLRNDKCFVVYELLERSAEIHFASSGGMAVAAFVGVICQAWLWRVERIALKRRDAERQNDGNTWTPQPPAEKA